MSKLSEQLVKTELPSGKVKAILRGGTFHRVQILVDPQSTYIEHCGLSYKVTTQKDKQGRLLCCWDQ